MMHLVKPTGKQTGIWREHGVTIRLREGRARPWMIDVGRGGKRIRRHYATEADARAAAVELSASFVNTGVQGHSLTLEQRQDAERALALLGGRYSLEDAARGFLEALPTDDTTVDELVPALLASREASGRRAKTVKTLRSLLAKFTKQFSGRVVAGIGYRELETWFFQVGKGTAACSRNNLRRAVGSLFEYGIARGACTVNVARRLPVASRDETLPAVLTPKQAKALLRKAAELDGGRMVPYFAIGLFAGLRPVNELARLEWRNVDLRERTIRVLPATAKRRRTRFVRIADNLAAWLEPYAKATAETVFFSRRSFRRILDNLKLEWPADVMRHSFASYLLAKTGNAAEVAMQLGHSQGSSVLWDHYRALVSPEDAERFFGIYPESTSLKARRRATSGG